MISEDHSLCVFLVKLESPVGLEVYGICEKHHNLGIWLADNFLDFFMRGICNPSIQYAQLLFVSKVNVEGVSIIFASYDAGELVVGLALLRRQE